MCFLEKLPNVKADKTLEFSDSLAKQQSLIIKRVRKSRKPGTVKAIKMWFMF